MSRVKYKKTSTSKLGEVKNAPSEKRSPVDDLEKHRKEDSEAYKHLLEAGKRLFAEKGFEGTSTREISALSGCNIGLISYYFKNKEGLYKAIIVSHAEKAASEFSDLMEKMETEKLTSQRVRDFITSAVGGVVTMKLKDPYVTQILQREVFFNLNFSKEVYEETFSPLLLRTAQILVRAQKQKILKKDLNMHTMFALLMDAIHGYFAFQKCKTSYSHKCEQLPRDRDQFIKSVVTLFLDGVMT